MILDLKKAKVAELEAELELYREALGDVVPALDTLKNNPSRVEAIEALCAEHGSPVRVDADFIAENKVLIDIVNAKSAPEDQVKEGELVFFDLDEITEAEVREGLIKKISDLVEEGPTKADFVASLSSVATDALEPLYEKMKADLESQKDALEPAPRVASGGIGTSPQEEPSVKVEHTYLKKTVVDIHNVLVNGKVYKDVTVSSGETFRLSQEEFDRDVRVRE